MIFVLYNLLFSTAFLLALPFYAWKMIKRGKYRDGFLERFGVYPRKLREALHGREVIWVQAVSVGEVMAALKLMEELQGQFPGAKILLTTTTARGHQVALQKAPDNVAVAYYPLDFYAPVLSAFLTFRPRLILLMEGEIWPNLLWMAQRAGVPVGLANADLSRRSERRYKRFGFFFRPVFRIFSWIFTQTQDDEKRFAPLGVRPEAVRTVGSLKFDTAMPTKPLPLDARKLLRDQGVAEGCPILVAGSTHEGEEEVVIAVWQKLREQFPALFLILAPRHDERSGEVATLLKRSGANCVRRTELTPDAGGQLAQADALLIDTTGELRAWYEAATVIVIGNSLVGHKGGHNIIEAAVTGHPVFYGPNMQDWEQIAHDFVRAEAAVQVADANELCGQLARHLEDAALRRDIGQRARALIDANVGAARRTAEIICESVA
ncbi:3-deoxy-D-manno-octulosonic acid transferase [Oscillatoria laete-virens NRMC-F 0139]|nr:3-deoxy-D-manno-octulosonic acid transferase [Oscillatoria laete-virens]MDL5054758.1 3-deoxy-D-manno-octulosonic acid transferase [Oscillatoria laete-virens NRMC-F 0139]